MAHSGKASSKTPLMWWIACVSCLSILLSPVITTFAEEISAPTEGEVIVVTDPTVPTDGDGEGGDSGSAGESEAPGDLPADTSVVPADTGDAAETGESGDTTAGTGETGDTSADTGEIGDTPSDTGAAPSETGDAPDQTGDAPPETGDTPADTGDGADDTGEVPASTGDGLAESGDAPADTSADVSGDDPATSENEPVQAPQAMDTIVESEPATSLQLLSVEEAGLEGETAAALTSLEESGDVTTLASALVPVYETPENVVAILVGSGVTYSNVGYTGATVAIGSFTGGTGIIGFEDGIILSSGDIAMVVGPNDDTGEGTSNGEPGDDALSTIVANDTYDAAVLTFDFVPAGNQIVFSYVFSSEEYNEYVNAGVNDVFAFFVNGENCATANGSFVSIDTINNDSNSELYVDNEDGHLNTEMDGMTVVLTCTATVNPGSNNTMKLAIADTGDSILDSNVFIQAKSFVVPTPTPSPTPTQVPGTPTPTPTEQAGKPHKPHKHYKSYKQYVDECADPIPAVALAVASTGSGGSVMTLPNTGAGEETSSMRHLLMIGAAIGAGVSLFGAIRTSRQHPAA